MEFYKWQGSCENLVKNKYQIYEPNPNQSPLVIPEKDTIICVPCIAMDKQGYRLGFGGGYYDRYLSRYPSSHTIGVLYSDFIFSNIPKDPWDIKLTAVVTENGVQRYE